MKKTFTVITKAFVSVDIYAENETEAERIALECPLVEWGVTSLSEEYDPIVYEEDDE